MENFSQKIIRAKELRKQGLFEKSLELTLEILEDQTNDQWLWWNAAMDYKNLLKLKDAILLCQKAIEHVSNSSLIKNLWAQLIFDFVKNNFYKLNGKNFFDAWQKIDELLTIDYKYLTREKVFYVFLKLMEKNNLQAEKKDFLNKIKIQPNDYQKNNTSKENENYPTVAETYTTEMAKMNYFQKDYKNCIDWATKAIDEFKPLKYDNIVWLSRLRAHCWLTIGEQNKALEQMFWVVEKKKAWFLDFEIAKMLWEIEKKEICKYFLLKCFADAQMPLFKIHVYEFVVEKKILYNNCFNPKDIEELWKELQTNKKNTPKAIELQNILQKNAKQQLDKTQNGKITKIMDTGVCFVELEEKTALKEIIFCRTNKIKELKQGQTVKLKIGWNWNKKKCEPSKIGIIVF